MMSKNILFISSLVLSSSFSGCLEEKVASNVTTNASLSDQQPAVPAPGSSLPVVPSTPAGVIVTAVASDKINVTWSDTSNGETGFKIERATNSAGPFILVSLAAANATSYSDILLTSATTYYYRISSYNAAGNSNYTPIVNTTTQTPIPSPVNNFSALAFSSQQINLTWVDTSNVEIGFKIERATSNAGPFTLIATTVANVSNYSDSGLASLTPYYYRISSYNGTGSSTYSAIITATTQAPAAPSAPTGLSALTASSAQINLNWTDTSNVETGFKIERATSNAGPFTSIATTAANISNFSDSGLTSSTTYYYRIYAFNGTGNSVNTTVVNATTQAPPVVAPTSPTTLTSSATASTQINIAWIDTSNVETGFKIERATSNAGPYTLIATTAANVSNYSDSGLTSSTAYFYRVYAYNAAGNSANTNIATATTFVAVPSAPTTLAATAGSASQINLTWTDTSTTEVGFKIERATNSLGPFSLIFTTTANAVVYSDTGLSGSVTYYYRILAFNASGSSALTATANATTLTPAPSAAANLVASAFSQSQINLSWSDTSNVETGFKIERATNSAGPFNLIATAAANAVSYSDTGLAPSTIYYYRVLAFNGTGSTAYTAVANTTTQAPAPPPESASKLVTIVSIPLNDRDYIAAKLRQVFISTSTTTQSLTNFENIIYNGITNFPSELGGRANIYSTRGLKEIADYGGNLIENYLRFIDPSSSSPARASLIANACKQILDTDEFLTEAVSKIGVSNLDSTAPTSSQNLALAELFSMENPDNATVAQSLTDTVNQASTTVSPVLSVREKWRMSVFLVCQSSFWQVR